MVPPVWKVYTLAVSQRITQTTFSLPTLKIKNVENYNLDKLKMVLKKKQPQLKGTVSQDFQPSVF
jgi:hypothetical protein